MSGRSIVARIAVPATLVAALVAFTPAAATAAPCASGTTNWTGATDNSFGTDTNWSNGGPSAACDAVISAATNTPVKLSGGSFTVDDLTVSAGRELDIESGWTLKTTTTANAGTIELGCPGCPTSATLQASSAATDALANSGTIVSTGIGGISSVNFLKGNVTNTGTLQVDQLLWWNSDTATLDTFTNKGTVSISTGCTKPGGDCFYTNETGTNFINDVGGNITNNGGSTFFLVESGFTQGAGNTSVGNPQSAVVMRGNLTMTGASSTAEISGLGPSQGINVSGTVGPGQTIKMPGGTLAVPSGTLFNQGTIRTTGSASSLTGNITTAGPGLLDIAATTTHSGGTLDATGGNILVGAQLNVGTLMSHGGQITGLGPINGNVNNVSGIVNPRNGIGSMTITGNYTQGAAGTLAIEAQGVAGPQHDLLLVGGGEPEGAVRLQRFENRFVERTVEQRAGPFRAGIRNGRRPDEGEHGGVGVVIARVDRIATGKWRVSHRAGEGAGAGAAVVENFQRIALRRGEVASLGDDPQNPVQVGIKKPVVFPGGKLGLEVDTGGSCRLTAVEKAVGSAQASATASKKRKKKPKGLVKKVTIYAYGSGTHVVPLNLTAKGKKLLRKKGKKKKGKASASASTGLKDPLVITCTPIVYPVANFNDGTQITGIGKAPTGNPPAGEPSIPPGPPAVKGGVPPTTQNPIVPLPKLPVDPPAPQPKKFGASVDLDKTVGARVSFVSDGTSVKGFDASFRVVCGFPFPESAPLETVHFDFIPASTLIKGGSVIQGSFELAKQDGSGSPPVQTTVSIQGDNSNGYTVRVYQRRAGCEGGTIFNARP